MKWILLIMIGGSNLNDAIDFILDFSENENENVNEIENENVNENENEDENVNDETSMPSDKDDDDETMSQNETKKSNDYLDKMIDKSKSFEDQIKSFKKVENLNQYCSINDFDDKELKSKIFKLKLAHLLKIIGKKLFKQIFGDALETLANKLINTRKKKKIK